MPDEPTLGEVMRHVQSLVRQVEALVKEVRIDYVRKDLYDAKHDALARQVNALAQDVEDIEDKSEKREQARLASQRQILGGIAIGVVLMLLTAALNVILILGGLK